MDSNLKSSEPMEINKLMKLKLKEFIEETKDNIESKSKQISYLVQSMKTENNRILNKCNYIIINNNFYSYFIL